MQVVFRVRAYGERWEKLVGRTSEGLVCRLHHRVFHWVNCQIQSGTFKGEIGREIPLLFGIPKFNLNRPRDGAFIGISGYPLQLPVLLTNAGWMATSWGFGIQRVLVPGGHRWFHDIQISDVYFADVEVNPGNSGSPVYLVENATVIGVCIASINVPIVNEEGGEVLIRKRRIFYNSGLTQVVPARYVIEVLRGMGLQ